MDCSISPATVRGPNVSSRPLATQRMQQLAHGLELQAGLAPDALYDAGGDLAPEAAQLRERLFSLFDAV
jgi:hypothetical protein